MDKILKNRISYHDIFAFFLFVLFVLSSVFYFYYFAYQKGFNYEPVEGFLYPTNTHDNYVYLKNIYDIANIENKIGLNNNVGIAYVYYFLERHIFMGLSFDYISLIVNLIVIWFSFLSYRKIIIVLNLDRKVIYSFFLCSSLIYFAQLINKDSFTILIILKAIEYKLQDRRKKFIILVFLSMIIRIQLPVLLIVFSFLSDNKIFNIKPLNKLIITYVFFSLVNGVFSHYQSAFISEETLSDGLSYIVYNLNNQFLIGSLLLNPLRVVQYFYGYLLSFDFVVGDKIDISRLKDYPQLISFIILSPFIIKCFLHYNKYMNQACRFLMAMIVSFFLIWLFNPSVSPRYLICFLPLYQLLAFYYLRFK